MLDSPHCPKDTINLKDFLVEILAAVHTSLLESCFSFLFIIESPHCLKDTINLKDFLVGILAVVNTSSLESCLRKDFLARVLATSPKNIKKYSNSP